MGDPHREKNRQLQHADAEGWFGYDDATKVVFEGAERQVLEVWGVMVHSAIELNNQDPKYHAINLGDGVNGNVLSMEVRERAAEALKEMGLTIGAHNPGGWDVLNFVETQPKTSKAQICTVASLADMRDYVDALEAAAAEQLQAVRDATADYDVGGKDDRLDLDTRIPSGPGPCP